MFSTYVGGSAEDCVESGAVGASGDYYVGGWSESLNLPTRSNSHQPSYSGTRDGFITALRAAGVGYVGSTFVGGSARDEVLSIALGASGEVVAAGRTESVDLTTRNPLDGTLSGVADMMLAGYSSDLSTLTFSTYWGGSAQEQASAIAVAPDGKIHIAGETTSGDYPYINGLQLQRVGPSIPFVRSSDGTASWSPVGGGLATANIWPLKVDPLDANRIYAIRHDTEPDLLMVSADGGQTWSDRTPPSMHWIDDVAADSAIAGRVYATQVGVGLHVSDDYGATWYRDDSVADTNRGHYPRSVATTVAAPGRVYVLISDSRSGGFPVVSDDSGETWTAYFTAGVLAEPNTYLHASSTLPNVVYTSDHFIGAFRSGDAGRTWTRVAVSGEPAQSRCRSFADSPSDGRIAYVACEATIYATSDGGSTWQRRGNLDRWVSARGLAVDPQNSNRLFAGSSFGFSESVDGGWTWSVTSFPDSEVTNLAFVGDTLYAGIAVDEDVAMASFSASASSVLHSTFLGGPEHNSANANAVLTDGSILILGSTDGPFPQVPQPPATDTPFGPFVLKVKEGEESCSAKLSPTVTATAAQIERFAVNAPSGCAWTAESDQTWAEVMAGKSGSGFGAVIVGVAPNAPESRTARITVSGEYVPAQTFTLHQAAADCSYDVAAEPPVFPVDGGSGTLHIETQSGCPWTFTPTGPDWAELGTATGSGPAEVGLTVDANPTLRTRFGHFNLMYASNASFQQSGPDGCLVGLAPNRIDIPAAGGPGETKVFTTSDDCDTSVSANQTWIELTSGSPEPSSPLQTLRFDALPNLGQARNATIRAGSGSAFVSQPAGTPMFEDVHPNAFYSQAVALFGDLGITDGCAVNPLRYCPDGFVTRGQMAVFLIRAIFGDDNFSFPAEPLFADVPPGHPFYKWIQKLGEMGITSGCAVRKYCPGAWVTRGQMAVFMLRVRFGAGFVPEALARAPFGDVPVDHPFRDWIRLLRDERITNGCSSNGFCPRDPVTRGQMALFLMRAAFNRLMPAWHPRILEFSPSPARRGETLDFSVQFVGFTPSDLDLGPGVIVESFLVDGTNSASGRIRVAADAPAGLRPAVSNLSGGTRAVLPNALEIRE